MDLILWRHAEALKAGEIGDDLARTLTAKGERQAHRVAQWLDRALPATARILVSPAARAQQTAKALGRKFRTCAPLAPGGSVEALIQETGWPASREPVLVIGHQPTLGLVAAHLVSGQALEGLEAWRLKKGGVWWLRRRDDDGAEPGVIVMTVRCPELP